MKAIIQRVKKASVKIDDKVVSEIQNGLLILLGIGYEDSDEDINWLVGKVANLRIFNDQKGIMNTSLIEIGGDCIVVSQFTLLANTKKGNRPSYIKAAKPEIAIPLYESFINTLENKLSKKVGTGVFGADMQIELCNDGPVTIAIDTKNRS